MVTYQDFQKATDVESFVISAINQHKISEEWQMAYVGDQYFRHRNITIRNYQKFLKNIDGKTVPDYLSPNYKLGCNFFKRLIIQQNNYLLGNGVGFTKEDTIDRLGKNFEYRVKEAGKDALIQGVSFGFWNFDHLEEFELLSFVPLWDEENGSLRAGIRFWQLDDNKPMRIMLYEEDGMSDYIAKNGNFEILREKKSYIQNIKFTDRGDLEIYDGENYGKLPIVPLWANSQKQSEMVGLREQIDAYDLIKSGFANDIDSFAQLYWVLENCDGMNDKDLMGFKKRLREMGVVNLPSDAHLRTERNEIPHEARERMLARLERDIYNDFMGFDIGQIASGNVVNAQIKAVYEPLNQKTDEYEYHVNEFIENILSIVGIDDKPTYTRSMINNANDTIRNVMDSADYLSEDYITKKVLEVLGDSDEYDVVVAQRMKDINSRIEDTEEDREKYEEDDERGEDE